MIKKSKTAKHPPAVTHQLCQWSPPLTLGRGPVSRGRASSWYREHAAAAQGGELGVCPGRAELWRSDPRGGPGTCYWGAHQLLSLPPSHRRACCHCVSEPLGKAFSRCTQRGAGEHAAPNPVPGWSLSWAFAQAGQLAGAWQQSRRGEKLSALPSSLFTQAPRCLWR